MEKLTKKDLEALGIFFATFNKRPDKNLYFSEKLLTEDDVYNYTKSLQKIKSIWQKQKKQKTPNN